MGQNASRNRPPAGRADIYWRRRVVALAVGLAIFALIAWAVNGTLSGPATARDGRPAGPAAHAGRSGAPAHAAATASAARHKGGPAAAGRRAGSLSSHHPGGGPGHRLAACPAGDVVLSLHQQQASYGRRARPFFEADIVSTASRPCAFNVGRRYVSVVIRTGQQSLWSSAACAHGAGSHLIALAKGVPVVLGITWDRTATPAGCQGQGRPVRAGTYVATAVSGHLASNSLIFVLRGHGIAVP
jgi:hypothetical protein